jgi:hypothetical protein
LDITGAPTNNDRDPATGQPIGEPLTGVQLMLIHRRVPSAAFTSDGSVFAIDDREGLSVIDMSSPTGAMKGLLYLFDVASRSGGATSGHRQSPAQSAACVSAMPLNRLTEMRFAESAFTIKAYP